MSEEPRANPPDCGCPDGECREGYDVALAFCLGCEHKMAVVFPHCMDRRHLGGCTKCESSRGIVRILEPEEAPA